MFSKPKYYYLLALTCYFLLVGNEAELFQKFGFNPLVPQVLAQTETPQKAEAERLWKQGFEQVNANQFQAALETFQQALTIYQQIGDREGEWNALFGFGLAYSGMGNQAKAIDSYQQTLILAQTIKNRALEWQSLNGLGTIYAAINDINKGIQYHEQSLVLAREIKDKQKEWFSLNALGGVYLSLSEADKAIEYYQQGLILVRNTSGLYGEEMSLRNIDRACSALDNDGKIKYQQQCLAVAQAIGKIQIEQPRENQQNILEILQEGQAFLGQKTSESLPKAIAKFEQALSILRNSTDTDATQFEALALLGIGSAYDSLGEKQKALDYFNQVLSLLSKLKNRQIEGTVKFTIGKIHADLSQYQQALEFYNQALPVYREIGDRLGQAITLNNIGKLYHARGEYQQALQYYNQAVPILEDLGDPSSLATSLGDIGLVYSDLGEYQKALEYYDRALPGVRKAKDLTDEATLLNNIGSVYFFLGQPQKTLEYYNQALNVEQQLGDRAKAAVTLANIATVYSNLGENQKALDSYNQALSTLQTAGNKEKEASVLNNIGGVYFDLNQNQKAIEFYQKSLSLSRQIENRVQEASALARLGQAYYDLQQYPQATEHLQQSLTIVRQMGEKRTEAIILNQLGRTELATGNLKAAEKTLLDGIKIWESIRAGLGNNDINKISIFEEQSITYRLAQKALIAQNKTDAALEIAERGRARAFVELLAGRLTENSNQVDIASPTIDQIKQIAKEQNATLVEYSIFYDDLNAKGQPKARESALLIWVIKPTGEVAFRQVNLQSLTRNAEGLKKLQELVASSRDMLGVRGRGLAVTARVEENRQNSPSGIQLPELQKLHQILIEPIADLLPKNPDERVIFIPQDELFLVPFAALQNSAGKYLIEEHTILTAPAIQVLDLTRQQRAKIRNLNGDSRTALVVGNPAMPKIGQPSEQLPSLPGSEREATEIATLLNTQPLLGKDATKSAILQQLPQAKVIHFATHGLLDDFQGLGVPGAVALAPSENDNGLLTASEILNLKLNAELVILSACDTGRGRLTGDGVIGLSRSIIASGVPSVIVSLWSVPDAPTASLMTGFYRNLQQNSDKAQALRNAMLATMKDHPNPRDWAAFTIIGEAE